MFDFQAIAWAIVMNQDLSKINETFHQKFNEIKNQSKNSSLEGEERPSVSSQNFSDVPKTNSTMTILRGLDANATSDEIKAGTVSRFSISFARLLDHDSY